MFVRFPLGKSEDKIHFGYVVVGLAYVVFDSGYVALGLAYVVLNSSYVALGIAYVVFDLVMWHSARFK